VSDAEPQSHARGRARQGPGARERARQGQDARARPEQAARPAGRAPSVDAQLAQARAWLAERRVPEARAAIEDVLRSGASRSARAEALSLVAECALVEQHYEQAVAAYLQVATQHPRLGAGQNALFAAARIRAQQGHTGEARALLHRYLDRYPAGRFRDEAERRLAQLDAPAAP
jgi:TolA-binding protein